MVEGTSLPVLKCTDTLPVLAGTETLESLSMCTENTVTHLSTGMGSACPSVPGASPIFQSQGECPGGHLLLLLEAAWWYPLLRPLVSLEKEYVLHQAGDVQADGGRRKTKKEKKKEADLEEILPIETSN